MYSVAIYRVFKLASIWIESEQYIHVYNSSLMQTSDELNQNEIEHANVNYI